MEKNGGSNPLTGSYMKQCNKCKELKSKDNFTKWNKSSDGLHNMCKECKHKYDKIYYRESANRKKSILSGRQDTIKKTKEYILTYLNSHPCVDCGESDPIVLEFDHVFGKKRNSVARIKNYSVSSVAKEIEKCEVRCANCHRRKTFSQLGWSR